MRYRSSPLFGLLLSVVALVAHGCGSGSSDSVPGPRRSVLIQLTDVVILPTYRALAARADVLVESSRSLRSQPSEDTLVVMQEAWRWTRQAWKQSEAFRLGPADDLRLRLRSKLDWSPANPNLIEQELAGGEEFTAEYVDALGVSRRGFLALEYLLFDSQGGNAAVLERLTGEDGARCLEFVAALAADLRAQSQRLVAAWDPEGDDYRGELVEAGRTSAAFPELKKAIDELVGAVVQLAVTVEEKKLGAPAGLPQGSPRPGEVEAARSANSATDILDNLESIGNVYRGDYQGSSGAGLDTLVLAAAPKIDLHIRRALTRARSAVAAIPGPLSDAVLSEPDAVARAFEAVHELRLTLAVDLVAALGATPRFTSDGD